MEHVVLEILEAVVGRLGALKVAADVFQHHPPPGLRIAASQVVQRIEREFVMRAVGVGGVDDAE